jgi:two-component system response regulator PilR (NtrC family)
VSQANTILVVEDTKLTRDYMARTLQKAGHEVLTAKGLTEAQGIVDSQAFDLVYLDLGLGRDDSAGQRGRRLFGHLQSVAPEVPVIIVTGDDTAGSAIELLRKGAYHYIVKPVEPDELLHLTQYGLELSAARRSLDLMRAMQDRDGDASWYVGQTPRMQSIDGVVSRFAPSPAGILLQGESGTGKEIVARALRDRSNRAEGPFVPLNCGAVPRDLLESELFGHEKGSFTGAVGRQIGLLELANGGTLFLDELSSMPAEMQTKLLRALQEFRFMRVGGRKEIKVDVRVISASNRDILDAIRAGEFRQDLYYRICVMTIELPPLRDRRVDIPYFVQLFIGELCEAMGTTVKGATDAAMWALTNYRWPGNIRELRNVIERAVILASGEERIDVVHLPEIVRAVNGGDPLNVNGVGMHGLPTVLPADGLDLKAVRDEWERSFIEQAIERSDGNQSAAARLLHLTRDELRYRVDKFDLAS